MKKAMLTKMQGIRHGDEDGEKDLREEGNGDGDTGHRSPVDLVDHIDRLCGERVDEDRSRGDERGDADIELNEPGRDDL
ncbi:MAG: hypothetical protein PWR16_1898 [Methanoculleus sp.]|nr:hypothetical protein [Methanoculleus sp.]